MGIINVTPDSFFGESRASTELEILNRAEKMLHNGAHFLDIGGASSRPGAAEITLEEELKRTIPAIQLIVKKFPEAVISIDTFRSFVAEQAIQEGASIINDISAGELDDKMFDVVAKLQVPYIAMHMKGTPQTMTSNSDYRNLVFEITSYFHRKIEDLKNRGVKDIIIDPGFGFAKTIDQNFELLNCLEIFKHFNRPVLVGLSRKSMIWKTLRTTPEKSMNGSTALHMLALTKGAAILRVHDVAEANEVVSLFNHLNK